MKRKLVLILAVMMVMVMLCSCGKTSTGGKEPAGTAGTGTSGGADTSGKGGSHVTAWLGSWWADEIPRLEKEFAEENPGYTVSIEPIPINNYIENAITSIVGGTPPDALALDALMIPTPVGQNLLLPLDDKMKEYGLKAEDFSPSIYDAGVINGVNYAIPYRSAPCVLFYNKTMFDEVGLEYPHDDWTFDELLNAAKALTIPGKRYGYAIGTSNADPANVMTNFAPVLWGFGADFLNEDLTECAINTPEGVAAIKWFAELHTVHKVVPEGCVNYTLANDSWPMAASNQIAMIQMGDSMIPTIKEKSKELGYEYGLCLEVGKHSRGGGWSFAIPVTAKNPDGAMEFIAWFVKPEVLAKQNIVLPGVKAAQKIGHWNDEDYQVYYKADEYAKLCPKTVKWTEIQNIVIIELQRTVNGEIDAATAAANMESKINEVLKN